MITVGLIGCGGIAQDVITAVRAQAEDTVRIVGALARSGRAEAARSRLAGVDVVETLDALIARKPDLIAEVAGQGAVAEHGEAVLRAGIDLVVISVGALADPALLARLKAAAIAGHARILLPAGAIGGIDAIAAMKVAGLTSVRYRSRKPPAAWRGSPAEQVADLGALKERTVLYTGSAGEAALRYPQNANVTAAVALAGLGFEATKVELVADPAAPGNVHEIEAEGAAGRFVIQLEGKPSRSNPKTSALAAMSVARALINAGATIGI
ncbi:MAG: aspartate dehydrogenase [Hyphomicrobiales bacterium]|nr:aspartate dehydrogenase [Hyphomicrobiales bacterium]